MQVNGMSIGDMAHMGVDMDVIVMACQDAVWTHWNRDSYIKEEEKEGRAIILAIHNCFGVDLQNPWETI